MSHDFVDAKRKKADALAAAHHLALEKQRENGGEIQYGKTAHELPPDRGLMDCEYVSVGDDRLWIVIQA